MEYFASDRCKQFNGEVCSLGSHQQVITNDTERMPHLSEVLEQSNDAILVYDRYTLHCDSLDSVSWKGLSSASVTIYLMGSSPAKSKILTDCES